MTQHLAFPFVGEQEEIPGSELLASDELSSALALVAFWAVHQRIQGFSLCLSLSIRKRYLPFSGSVPKAATDRSGPDQELYLSFQHGFKGTSTWAIFCFPRVIRGNVERKWSHGDSSRHSYGMPAFQVMVNKLRLTPKPSFEGP